MGLFLMFFQGSNTIQAKDIQILTNFSEDFYVKTDSYLFSIILITYFNALKYSKEMLN
jgi:hypothetical protein